MESDLLSACCEMDIFSSLTDAFLRNNQIPIGQRRWNRAIEKNPIR